MKADRVLMALACVALSLGRGTTGACQSPAPAAHTLLFFGDSLTAGYGLTDPDTQSFPALVQRKIDDARLPWHVVNAGLSGETSAGGLRRIDWVLKQKVDMFVLELGANDGLRGSDPEAMGVNLQAIIDKVRSAYPKATLVLAGMQMPASMGADYRQAFHAQFDALAARNGAIYIPFLLEGVGGRPELNQADSIHPTAQGEVIVANLLWQKLLPILSK